MTNLNENAKCFDMNEEELEKVTGGTENWELSEMVIENLKQKYGQPDGTFKFVCPECGTVITGTYAQVGKFFDEMNAHILTHIPDMHFENYPIPIPGNPNIH